jgi:hypothetical protein
MGPDFIIPDMHGWPISPDFAVLLIRVVEAGGYDAVIEFGSGVSTAILAKALTKVTQPNGSAPVPFVSFDHLEKYYHQTAASLDQAQLRHQVDLQLVPLAKVELSDSTSCQYYTCQPALTQLRKRLDKTCPKILVIVDGPPAATSPKARYPAIPLLWETFEGKADFDVLLDDYIRDDEREIVQAWEDYLVSRDAKVEKREYLRLEKQACLLEIRAAT